MLPFQKSSSIHLTSVKLGSQTYALPVAQFQGNNSLHRILITGGMDGDEYAGIEAAYRLIEKFSTTSPLFTTAILPIVNLPGFLKGVSYNPLDGKYPKHIFPGKKNGNPTEQLLHWLSSNFLQDTTVWLDLHSGAFTEELNPFIWTYRTKKTKANQITLQGLSTIQSSFLIYDQYPTKKINDLVGKGTSYFLLESGQKGERDEKSIQQHITWVDTILSNIALQTKSKKIEAFNSVNEYPAQQDGLWFPKKAVGSLVQKGDLLGELSSFDKKRTLTITSRQSGLLLWQRTAMSTKKGDTLLGVAVDQRTVTPSDR